MAEQRYHEGGYERAPRGRGRFERERDERGTSRTMPPREEQDFRRAFPEDAWGPDEGAQDAGDRQDGWRDAGERRGEGWRRGYGQEDEGFRREAGRSGREPYGGEPGRYRGLGAPRGGGYGLHGERAGESFAGRGPKGYRRSDERVLEDANQTLEDDPRIDATEIEVAIVEGEIVLRGSVPDRRTKRLAEDAIENLPGVKDVRNELRASSGKEGTDSSQLESGPRQSGKGGA